MIENTIVTVLESLLRLVNTKKTDDGLDGPRRRQWAVVYTELEAVYARVKTYLFEE
jgi:hypothetical protein